MDLARTAPGTLQFDTVARLEEDSTALARGYPCREHGLQPAVQVELDRWTHQFRITHACCDRFAALLEVMVEGM